jgi:hypothetical protein
MHLQCDNKHGFQKRQIRANAVSKKKMIDEHTMSKAGREPSRGKSFRRITVIGTLAPSCDAAHSCVHKKSAQMYVSYICIYHIYIYICLCVLLHIYVCICMLYICMYMYVICAMRPTLACTWNLRRFMHVIYVYIIYIYMLVCSVTYICMYMYVIYMYVYVCYLWSAAHSCVHMKSA